MKVRASPIRLGSSPSPLARRRARTIAGLLEASRPDIEVDIVPVIAQAEREFAGSLPETGGGESFVQELQTALLEGRIDLAGHSLMDVPLEESAGLTIGAIPRRSDARDALITNDASSLADLPANPRIGVAGLCRRAQVLLVRPDARLIPPRGGLEAQLARLEAGEYHSVVLALCDLQILGLTDYVTQVLDYDTMLPEPGQGALAVQCRADDQQMLSLVSSIHDPESWARVAAERAFLRDLGADCGAPVAAYAEVRGVNLRLLGLIASVRDSREIRVSMKALFYDPAVIGETLAEKALALGAGKLLNR